MKKILEDYTNWLWINHNNLTNANNNDLALEQYLTSEQGKKALNIPVVVGRSEQLPCEHKEQTMQGNGFTYVICSKCGADL